MLPEKFISRIKQQEYIDGGSLMSALETPSPSSIRINPSKWNRIPHNSEPVPWSATGWYLSKRPSFTLDPLFHSGCYYPQEASSMAVEQAVSQTCNTGTNLKILDLCAAPGGKSTHLSSLLSGGSILVANEVIRSRASVLAAAVSRWGTSNTIVTQSDPSSFGSLPGYFDVVLVDAPCSGEGMFRTDVARREWSEENAAHCSERQKRILSDVWTTLKQDGILIYSTCTFNPDENERNIKWLVDSRDAETVRLDVNSFPGVTEISFQGVFGYGFYPHRIKGDGFFMAVVRKKNACNSRPSGNSGSQIRKPDRNEAEIAERWTEFQSGRLIKWGEDVYALHCGIEDFHPLLKNLRVVKPGTRIFTTMKNDFIPSHELALSTFLKEDAFPRDEADLRNALAYLRKDQFISGVGPRGWVLETYRNIALGFAKNVGSRTNNYLPVELRIRMDIPHAAKTEVVEWKD